MGQRTEHQMYEEHRRRENRPWRGNPVVGAKSTHYLGNPMLIFVIVFNGLVDYMDAPHHWMPNPAAQGPVVGRLGREAERAGGDFQQG